jgi:hypothetical protein
MGATHDTSLPLRAERRTLSGAAVATTLVCFHFLHTGLRTHHASGVPRALSTEGDDVNHTSDVETRREIAELYPPSIAV